MKRERERDTDLEFSFTFHQVLTYASSQRLSSTLCIWVPIFKLSSRYPGSCSWLFLLLHVQQLTNFQTDNQCFGLTHCLLFLFLFSSLFPFPEICLSYFINLILHITWNILLHVYAHLKIHNIYLYKVLFIPKTKKNSTWCCLA